MISAVVGIHYYNLQMIICLHLHRISDEERSCKEKVIVSEDVHM